MSPRPDVSEERRSQIIEAATSVFARQGFNKARMDDIAKEAGVSKGTLYWYFENKDDIITTILDTMIDRQLAYLDITQESEPTAKAKLLKFNDDAVADVLRMKPILSIMLEFWGLLLRRKSLHRIVNNYYKRYFDAIRPIIQEGIDRGEFREVDAESVTVAAGAIYEGTILMWAFAPEVVDLEKHINAGIHLLIEGMECKP